MTLMLIQTSQLDRYGRPLRATKARFAFPVGTRPTVMWPLRKCWETADGS